MKPIFRAISVVFYIVTGVFLVVRGNCQTLLGQRHDPVEIRGEGTNDLQPIVQVSKNDSNWRVGVDLLAHTNFAADAWLKTTSRIGCRIELWTAEGIQVVSSNSDVLAAMAAPSQTTVSNILRSIPRRWRSSQWWRTGARGSRAGETYLLSAFDLQSAFSIPLTNDVAVRLVPLIYEVETNKVSARLVEFPPIKLKLMSGGEVRQIQ